MAHHLPAADIRAQPRLAQRQVVQDEVADLERLRPLLLLHQLLEPHELRVCLPLRVDHEDARVGLARAAAAAAAAAAARGLGRLRRQRFLRLLDDVARHLLVPRAHAHCDRRPRCCLGRLSGQDLRTCELLKFASLELLFSF